MYYHVYDIDDERNTTEVTHRRTESLLQDFRERLRLYAVSGGVDFSPEWMVVFTWSNAVPYYGRYNMDEVCMCVCLFAIA